MLSARTSEPSSSPNGNLAPVSTVANLTVVPRTARKTRIKLALMRTAYEKLKAHQKKQKDKAKRSTTTTTGSGGQEKPVFDEKGRPLKHNKHGKLVIDSAMLAKQKREQGDKDTKTDSTKKDEPMVALTQSKEVQAALNEVDREAQSLQYSLPQESRAPAAAYMASVDTLKKLLTKR